MRNFLVINFFSCSHPKSVFAEAAMLPLKKANRKKKKEKPPSSLLATTIPWKTQIRELAAFQISLPGSLALKIPSVTDASRMWADLEHSSSRAAKLSSGFLEQEKENKREKRRFLKMRLSSSHKWHQTERPDSLERKPTAFLRHLSEP